jgi:hypothetical protein
MAVRRKWLCSVRREEGREGVCSSWSKKNEAFSALTEGRGIKLKEQVNTSRKS